MSNEYSKRVAALLYIYVEKQEMTKKIGVIFLFVCWSVCALAQLDSLSVAERNALQGFNDTIDRTAEDFVTVSLVVCDPGDVLYSTLGHAALHLQCPIFNLDYIYSYESESVRDRIWTFLRGGLKMGMFAIPTVDFLESYRETGRGVKEYIINLSPEQEQQLWKEMDIMAAEGLNLPYDYFSRGCAKSVVHVIHRAIGNSAIHYAPWSKKYSEHTLRELATSFAANVPWIEFISYFLVGVEGDKAYPCEKKLIVPTDLVEVWQQATFDSGKPVLETTPNVLLDASKVHKETWLTPLLISIVLLVLAIGSLITKWSTNRVFRITGNVIDYVILTIISIIGAVMTYLIFFSNLPCTTWNWLIIPFNIIPLIAWHWRKYWALPWALGLIIWIVAMVVYPHRIVDVPHLILTAAFAVVLIKQWLMAETS